MADTIPRFAAGRRAVPSGRTSRWSWSTLAQVSVLITISMSAAACSSGSTTTALAPTRKAARHAHHGGNETGVVSAVTAVALTIVSHGSHATYALSPSTTYREEGSVATESAVTVGAHVRLHLSKNAASPTVATVLVLLPTVSGTVKTLTSAGFKVTSRKGAVHVVVTTPATTFYSGKQTVTDSALKDAQHVRVTGQTLPNGSTRANTVRVSISRGG